MDIERLKKLNLLAGELKHQGIAHNHEDAAYLAVTMVGEEEEQCLSDMHINDDQSLVIREIIKGKSVKPQESLNQESKPICQKLEKPEKQGMTNDDVQQVFQGFAAQIVSEFTSLHKKIEQSNAQIVQLAQQINALQSSTQKTQTEVQEQIPVQRTLNAQPPAAASSAANPRTGNFATEDVSIEKMFYYGKK